MRLASPILAVILVLSGCAFNAGAGVGGRLGNRPGAPSVQCDNFESCDAVYQDALGDVARCRAEGGDCEDEELHVTASYAQLREQTELELEALRNEVRERGEAFGEPPPPAPCGPVEKGPKGAEPAQPSRQPESGPPRHGNGWFESEQQRQR
jgi:hypothetical protein